MKAKKFIYNRPVQDKAKHVEFVFVDVDGTLCSFETHRPMPRTMTALAWLKNKGVKIALATGRSEQALEDLRRENFDAFICSSGQNCLLPDGKVLREARIPRADLQSLLNLLKTRQAAGMPVYALDFIAVDQALANHHSAQSISVHERLNFIQYPVADFEEISKNTYLQLMFFGDEEGQEEIMRVMPNCQATRWHPDFIDIMPKAGGKGDGLLAVCRHFGVDPENTICFGDGENDIAMFRKAGISVAMGNATAAAKAAADCVTCSVDEEGVFVALQEMGLLDGFYF